MKSNIHQGFAGEIILRLHKLKHEPNGTTKVPHPFSGIIIPEGDMLMPTHLHHDLKQFRA